MVAGKEIVGEHCVLARTLPSASPQAVIQSITHVTTVRLKVEQIQLVSGVFIVGLACIGLQGA